MKSLMIIVQVWLYCCRGDAFKDPSYQILASQCLKDIFSHHFTLGNGLVHVNETRLLTFVVTDNLTSPAYEIQENLIKQANSASSWLLFEVVSVAERHQFFSYSVCHKKICRRHFVVNYKSKIFIIVIDQESNFDEILERINRLSSFNPSAYYLIYLENDEPTEAEAVAEELLWKLWEYLISLAVVLIPNDSETFILYTLNFTTESSVPCGSQGRIVSLDQCREGQMQQKERFYFAESHQSNYYNCSIGVIAKPYAPFVIDQKEGFEIKLLKTFGETVNLHLNISLTTSRMDSLGSKRNGSFTRSLKLVYEQLYIAVGNIEMGGNYTDDFEFSTPHHMEPLVFIVPKAKLVPRWRVFIAIFTLQMWGVCLGVMIAFAALLFWADRYPKESQSYSIKDPLLTSFQVIVGHAVYKQPGPGRDIQRVFFVSLNMFSIIIYSVYTCSLVYYLKNPISEYQIHDNSEIYDQFDNLRYHVGGIKKYKEVFSTDSSPHAQKVLKNYETIPRKNETVAYWLEVVGNRDDFVTLASHFYVSYLIANNDNITTYPDGKPKIFVYENKLLTYAVSLMLRKGHPLLKELNIFISKMLSGGFVKLWCNEYIRKIGKDHATDNMKNDNPFESLTTEHLQGAFAILAGGYVLGFLIFLFEKLHKKVKDMRKKN